MALMFNAVIVILDEGVLGLNLQQDSKIQKSLRF